MQVDLHIETLETERRWNRLQWFESAALDGVLGKFLAYKDQETFIWLRAFHAPLPDQTFVRSTQTIRLTPAFGSTITEERDFARISESPLLELRQYRIAPGARRRFAEFLRNRTYDEHVRLGMPVYGPFDALDDEDLIVWFRGFSDLQDRDRRKAQFYQGDLWVNELESEAMAMIADYSNIMLIAPVNPARAT
jgi:hypothetical protein